MRSVLTAAGLVFAFSSGQAQTVNIWPGVAPGSETWTWKERTVENTPLGTVVFNVVTPTLTAYLPERARATGTSVIIAPGGAFVALAIDLEGHTVARWLQERGIAAFVLKYRIMEKRQDGIPAMNMDTAGCVCVSACTMDMQIAPPPALLSRAHFRSTVCECALSSPH